MSVTDPAQAGRAVVAAAVRAHGGLERWRSHETVRFRYRERWSAPYRWLGQNPWPRAEVAGEVTFWLHRARAEIRFDHAPAVTWRYDDGVVTASDGRMPDWNAAYALPRTHYLTLLPFKFLDEGARHTLLGTRMVDGRRHDEVLVTFADGVGPSPRDRYWALIDVGDRRLRQLFLTVTAYHPLAHGDVVYEGWQEAEGLLFPTVVQAYYPAPWGRSPLHRGEYGPPTFQ